MPLRGRQMLAHRIPSEAELQPDLDVGTPLGVELLSTLKVIAGEASPATGRLRGLAAGGTDGDLCDADFGSDLTDRHARADQIEDLLLLRCADRTTSRVADAASRRGLAHLPSRRYANRAQFRSHLTRNETLAEGEQGLPVVCVELAEAHHSIAIQTLTTGSETRYRVSLTSVQSPDWLRGAWSPGEAGRTVNVATAHPPRSYRVGGAEGTHARSQTIHEGLQVQRQVGVDHPHHIPVGEKCAKLLAVGVEDDVLPRHH